MTIRPRLIQIISLFWLLLTLGLAAFLIRPAIDSWSSAFYTQISKDRQCSDKIVLVTLDDLDIRSLGGWPVSRDYFAYMIHALTDRGAQTIGLDFLFSETDSLFKEYDDALAGFIESSGRVVLPAIVQSGEEALLPAKPFKKRAAIGFSNLGDELPIRTIPLVMDVKDSLWSSFGLALAQHYLNAGSSIAQHAHSIEFNDSDGKIFTIPIDSHFNFHLNYFGGLDRVSKIGFVELLRAFESNPDSLDFTGKLVLVAPVAQTLPVIKQIPKTGSVPGSFIHLTVAENILTNRFIRPVPAVILNSILFLFTGISFWMILNRKKLEIISLLAIFCITWFIAGLILYPLTWIQLSFSPVFYSILVLVGLSFLWGIAKYSGQKSHNLLLEQEIDQTKIELNRVLSEKQLSDEERKEAVLSLEKHLRDLKAIQLPEISDSTDFKEIIHAPDSPMRTVLDQVRTVASDNIPVLILGETGTGKELIARAIHQNSPRSKREFMAVNCGALSENLLESELFGHERGSFTGAHTRRIGRFEQANGGTLFLDEISETSAAFQARLLRVLQEGVFERVGGQQPIKTDVRIVAATNRNLKQEIDSGNFRADLFFRLNGFPIQLPPLRERKTDIPLLVSFFIQRHGKEALSISQAALERMLQYGWPGNVRELENGIRRAAILASSRGHQSISAEDLPEELSEIPKSDLSNVQYLPLEEQILSFLRSYKFSRSAISETARTLGNRDRGTITEYFRGLCFQALVEKSYSIQDAVIQISGSTDPKINILVRKKFDSYLANITSIPADACDGGQLPSTFLGLPKQFHPFLIDLIRDQNRIH